MEKMNVVSLFSGGGGLDLGFLKAGFKIIWAIDNEKNAVDTYRFNIGNHIKFGDINKVEYSEIPFCDVIIGGPPCQSFSLAGNRKADDKRGHLVWKYIDIIKHIKPRAFLFENVTGLLSARNSNGEKILPLLEATFRNIGYNISSQIIDATEFGIPQRRKRVIIVGLSGNNQFIFPCPTHGDRSTSKTPFVTVADAISDLPSASNNENAEIPYDISPMSNYQKVLRKNATNVTDHFAFSLSDLDKYIISNVKPGGNYMDIPADVPSKRIRRLQKDGGHTTCYGRLLPTVPSYTINTYFNRPNVGCNIHYKEDRLITVREALRLQSFPDSYKIISSSKKGRNLIVGNAVPPQLSFILANTLKGQLMEEK
ncbi:MAG: DNA cytosine methyltransferase [Oscillospiraceae bacterium]|jgi:DNA (cytosine-5)-methyltransferase 1|nr:DNA cytosine methyltransferase [Oscillospiraceae bacterium]